MKSDPDWDALVARQHGAFDVGQALGFGIDHSKLSRLVVAGAVRRGLPGVYLMSSSTRTKMQRLHEVRLWAGEGSALSHTTSASLLGLDVVPERRVHVTTSRNLRSPASNVVVHKTRAIEARDLARVRGLVVTTMPRTIIDLSSVLHEQQLDIALDSAIRNGMSRSGFLTRFDEVAARGLTGSKMLRKLIAERETEQGLPGSAFERYLLRLLRDAGLPRPVCQYPFVRDTIRARIDFAYPEFGIAIEADGYRWHDGRVAYEKDRLRVSELGSWGWRVLLVTWLQLKYHPDDVCARIERALGNPAFMALRS